MEIRQIRYFVAVAEEGNFTAAANRLFVSQPPITRQIQKLEAELGVQLFKRGQKGITLTAAGTAFLEEARQILIRARLATERSQAAARGEIGKLEIGYFGSPIYSILPRIIRGYCAQNEHVDVALHPINKREQPEAVSDGLVHVCFGRYYSHSPGIAIETIVDENILLAVSVDHPRAGQKEISAKQLQSEPMIIFPRTGRPSFADEVIRLLREQGVEPDIVYEAADLSSAMAMTAAGRGICPIPEFVAQLSWPDISCVKIGGISAQSPVSCIYLEKNESPLLKEFLSVARNMYP